MDITGYWSYLKLPMLIITTSMVPGKGAGFNVRGDTLFVDE